MLRAARTKARVRRINNNNSLGDNRARDGTSRLQIMNLTSRKIAIAENVADVRTCWSVILRPLLVPLLELIYAEELDIQRMNAEHVITSCPRSASIQSG